MSTKNVVEKEASALRGSIPFDDPMVTQQMKILPRNLAWYGLKGLLNFGRCRRPSSQSVQASIERVSASEYQYISSVWLSWSFVIVPCTAVSYLLWTAPNQPAFNAVTARYRMDLPAHALIFPGSIYVNCKNVCRTLSLCLSLVNVCCIWTASALNYNAPTPRQPDCQLNIGVDHTFYPYYKSVELEQYAENVWISQLPFVFQSLQFGIRMVIVALDDDDDAQHRNVLVYSPIKLTQSMLHRIRVEHRWNVRYLVAPNSIHHLFLPQWIEHFPDCAVIAPPNLQQRRTDVRFDHVLDIDVEDAQWKVVDIPQELNEKYSDIVEFMVIKTGIFHEEIVMLHKPSKTLVVADHIENLGFEPESSECEEFSWLSRCMLSLAGMKQRPAAPADLKLVVNREWYRKSVLRVMQWDFGSIVPAHGRFIERNAKDVYVAANSFVL